MCLCFAAVAMLQALNATIAKKRHDALSKLWIFLFTVSECWKSSQKTAQYFYSSSTCAYVLPSRSLWKSFCHFSCIRVYIYVLQPKATPLTLDWLVTQTEAARNETTNESFESVTKDVGFWCQPPPTSRIAEEQPWGVQWRLCQVSLFRHNMPLTDVKWLWNLAVSSTHTQLNNNDNKQTAQMTMKMTYGKAWRRGRSNSSSECCPPKTTTKPTLRCLARSTLTWRTNEAV